MSQPVALLTDFGLADPYLAQMKGVLLSLNRDVTIIDISHQVQPFNPVQAGFLLNASREFFPKGTIFVAVVDPGVGGDRRIVVLEKFGQVFMAPDNGLLSLVLEARGRARVYDVTRPSGLSAASATFHGRDVFAPVAAHLSKGGAVQEVGPEIPLDSLLCLPLAEPVWVQTSQVKEISASVLHVDRFGNCLLNLFIDPWLARIQSWPGLFLVRPEERPVVLVKNYARLPEKTLCLLAGSQGVLELCLDRASAAKALGLEAGHAVRLSCSPGTPGP